MSLRGQRTLPSAKFWVAPAIIALAATASSQPTNPTYFNTFFDAITGTNEFFHNGNRYWDVTPGADSYQNDFYERPTAQTYSMQGGRYAASEYLGYVDITQARVGFDSNFLYVSISMFSLNKGTSDGTNTRVGLVERYGFRFGSDADGRGSFLLVVDQPELANNPNTTYSRLKTFGYRDADGDVGGRGLFLGGPTGRSVTKSDNPLEEQGMNGYNSQIISDGRLQSGQDVLWSRISPTDNKTVEMAFRYTSLGLTQGDLLGTQYLEFEAIKGGPKDPQNYLWNDKYTKSEAGSPNPGTGGLSEFGTQGLGNIYELDTLRGGAVPEPATLFAVGGALALLARRRLK